eukprot:13717676-Alexandrium_andersonii.AAC.1
MNVSGAFDKNEHGDLAGQTDCHGNASECCRLLRSWLGPRTTRVVLKGRSSAVIEMSDMVFQGTSCQSPSGFAELIYADDLNAFRVLGRDCSGAAAFDMFCRCQNRLHRWKAGNR